MAQRWRPGRADASVQTGEELQNLKYNLSGELTL